jgi:hypothetical protein
MKIANREYYGSFLSRVRRMLGPQLNPAKKGSLEKQEKIFFHRGVLMFQMRLDYVGLFSHPIFVAGR